MTRKQFLLTCLGITALAKVIKPEKPFDFSRDIKIEGLNDYAPHTVDFWMGDGANVRVYDEVLTAEQITKQYNADGIWAKY